jgi:surface carbohydrate biosynthesis protein
VLDLFEMRHNNSYNGRKPWLYIFVEVGKREMLSRLILAKVAVEAGFRVLIGEKNHLRNLLFFSPCPPGIILDKCGQQADSPVIRQLKQRGFVYTVLDEEGIFYHAPNRNPTHGIDFRFVNNWLEYKQLATRSDVAVTGNLRLNPQQMLFYYRQEIDEIRRCYGEFILVCSSFDPIYPSYSFREEEAMDEKFRADFKYIIQEVSKAHRVVYRPHPSDGNQFANEISTCCAVEKRFAVTPWIHSCSLLINAKCTTSIEAYLLGKPSVTLSYKSPLHRRVNAFSKKFYVAEQLIDYVNNGNYLIDQRRIISKYIEMIAGPCDPANNIVNVLKKLKVEAYGASTFLPLHSVLTGFFNRVRYRKLSSYIEKKFDAQLDLTPFRPLIRHQEKFLLWIEAP